VDNSLAPGIGHRLDGWANRDLNVGAIVALAPNRQLIADLLKADVPTVKKVLASWGPGRFDAELDKDGKAFPPDGQPAGTLGWALHSSHRKTVKRFVHAMEPIRALTM
jgi:hypothetical protein